MKLLRSDVKAPALKMNESLQNAASDHANDMAATGITNHVGSDGSNFKDRIERYTLIGGYIYQSIVYQDQLRKPIHSKDIIKHLMMDKFVPKKQNRNNIMANHHLHFGAAVANHPKTGQCYVLLYGS